MEHRHLIGFLAVCDAGSFSKASEKLHMTQQGLGRSIRQLESELGVTLFCRSSHGVSKTAFGEQLEKSVRPYIHQHDYIVSQIGEMRANLRERLTLGISGGMGDVVLPKGFFSDFLLANPQIDLSIRSFYDDSCMQSLLDAQTNAAFCPAPYDRELFTSMFMLRRRERLLVGKGHRLAGRSSVRLSELAGECVAKPSTRDKSEAPIESLLVRNGAECRFSLTFSDFGLVMELVSRGCAVGLFAGDPRVLPDCVEMIDIEDYGACVEYHLLVNRRMSVNDSCQRFIDYAAGRL